MPNALLLAILLARWGAVHAPAAGPPAGSFDQAVGEAIRRGAAYLWSIQQDDGSWAGGAWTNRYPVGMTALVAYALLESGVSPQDARMAKTLAWLAERQTDMTYSVALRANVWLAAERNTPKYHKQFQQDVRRLVASSFNGTHSYYAYPGGRPSGQFANAAVRVGSLLYSGDNSNAQYGVLGVWAGARADIEVPATYFAAVERHWTTCQNDDGGWGYTPNSRKLSYGAMTAAGVATLFVCFDNLHASQFAQCRGGAQPKPIRDGLAWLEKHFSESLKPAGAIGPGRVITIGGVYGPTLYYLFGIERVGLASGYKYLGTADWYKIGGGRILQAQRPDGSWQGGWADGGVEGATAYALLFLVRGRHPVLFNKLEFGGDWNNRPRDLASLTRWIGRTFEATVNWQIINLQVPVSEWHDAPILYLSAAKAPRLADEHLDKLRTFVYQGGTLFSCTECSGRGFHDGIRQVYAKLFPKYELTPLGPEHELYSVHFTLGGRPKFYAVSNGVRPLAIHTDVDLPKAWQLRMWKTGREAFEAAANLFMYVTDKGSLRHRGVSLWPAESRVRPATTVTLARLAHSGNHDPEPLAYQRFARLMADRAGTGVNVVGPLPIARLPDSGAQVATLTGTGQFTLTAEEKRVLKAFIDRGGTLVLDAAGGSEAFAEAARQAVGEMYDPASLRALASTAPLYRRPGMEIRKVNYRRRTLGRLGMVHDPNLRAVLRDDRPAVIYSREDLTAGLVGYPSYTCDGYDPESAFAIMRNIVLSAAEVRPPAPPSPPAPPAPQPASAPSSRPLQPATSRPARVPATRPAVERFLDRCAAETGV